MLPPPVRQHIYSISMKAQKFSHPKEDPFQWGWRSHPQSRQTWGMNKPFFHDHGNLTISWNNLQMAWRMLATPEKQKYIQETMEAVWMLREEAPEKAIFTLVAASAWLTEENWTGSDVGWMASRPRDGSGLS